MKLKYILIISVLLVSCKKYDLEEDKSIFIGNWKWVYSIEKHPDPGGNGMIIHQVLPTDNNKTYSMEFRENGKFLLREGDDVIHREKAKFATWDPVDTAEIFYFSIIINDDTRLEGKIFGDTIVTYQYAPPFYFPSFDADNEYSSYSNYFVRE